MGVCAAGIYKDNTVIKITPFVCFGGYGQPPCKYLTKCKREHLKNMMAQQGLKMPEDN